MMISGACFFVTLCGLWWVPVKGNNFSLAFPHVKCTCRVTGQPVGWDSDLDPSLVEPSDE